jgi:hypothetical protein
LAALLGHLAPTEREGLTRLSNFRTRLGEAEFAYAGVLPATIRRWLDLSLVQREVGQAASLPNGQTDTLLYLIHPVVREYLLDQLSPDQLRDLHIWAAAFQGQPFVEMARAFAAQSGQSRTEAEIEALARDRDGVVGYMVRRIDHLGQAKGAMARALEWQYHLFAAGEYKAAGAIVTAVWAILDRWGERDRAKALLRSSIDTRDGFGKAVAQGNLATLLKDEGKLTEALATYEAVYRIFEPLGPNSRWRRCWHRKAMC